jgi:hypothetical protein
MCECDIDDNGKVTREHARFKTIADVKERLKQLSF